MLFQHTWEKVLSGQKTQTRRLRHNGELLFPSPDHDYRAGQAKGVETPMGQVKWQVGKDYAVQPARTGKAIARIQIVDIRRQDVRDISLEDAIAEGFKDELDFWHIWYGMYDKYAFKNVLIAINREVDAARKYLRNRESYKGNIHDAWALTFTLIKE